MSGNEAVAAPNAGGVTTIELFFDLGFVFTITQLTRVVAEDPTVAGVARSMLIFGNLWWMYGGYVRLTNTVPLQGTRERVLLLVGMAGFLVAALGIPSGFTGGSVALGLGYLLVNAVHSWVLLGRIEGSVLHAPAVAGRRHRLRRRPPRGGRGTGRADLDRRGDAPGDGDLGLHDLAFVVTATRRSSRHAAMRIPASAPSWARDATSVPRTMVGRASAATASGGRTRPIPRRARRTASETRSNSLKRTNICS
jgi:hypothetical protein